MLNTNQHSSYSHDLLQLRELQEYTCQALEQAESSLTRFSSCNLTLTTATPDDRSLRINLFDRQALTQAAQLYFVGFFGEKKPRISSKVRQDIVHFDAVLSRELAQYPHILAYSSLELPDHYNYANLVIFSQLGSLEEWKGNSNHLRASKQISPRYYTSVRIHMGTLETGIRSDFKITRTNFYDFSHFTPGLFKNQYSSQSPDLPVSHPVSSQAALADLGSSCYSC